MDKLAVSLAKRDVSMFAVSDIFNLRFILPFNKLAVSLIKPCSTVESDLSLAVIAVESNNILALKSVTLSPSAVPVEFVNLLILLDKLAVSRAKRDVSIFAVSDIFNLRFILPFNKLAVSLIKLCSTVESDLSLVVIAVESDLNFVVIAVESNNIFALIAVESDLSLAADTEESDLSLSLIEVILSINAPLALEPSKIILLDKETVSRANLLLNMFAVSAILSFKLILLLNTVESDLNFAVITVESNKIFALKSLTLSDNAPPVDAPKDEILRESDAVSRANLLLSILAVSAIFSFKLTLPLSAFELSTNDVLMVVESERIFNLNRFILSVNAVPELFDKLLILFDKETVSLLNLLLNIEAVSEIFTFRLILLFNTDALSTKEVLILVESDLILLANIFESKSIFALTSLILSPSAPSVAPASKLILLDKETVSRPKRLDSIKAVSVN